MNIKELAEQAGWNQGASYDDCIACSAFDMQKFAELVAAHEREECAMLFQRFSNRMKRQAGECVDAIRARGKA